MTLWKTEPVKIAPTLLQIMEGAAEIASRYTDAMGSDRDLRALAEMVEGLAQAIALKEDRHVRE